MCRSTALSAHSPTLGLHIALLHVVHSNTGMTLQVLFISETDCVPSLPSQTGLHIIPWQYSLLQTSDSTNSSLPWDSHWLPRICQETRVSLILLPFLLHLLKDTTQRRVSGVNFVLGFSSRDSVLGQQMCYRTHQHSGLMFGLFMPAGMPRATSGPVRPVKEMTTSFTAILLTRRSQSRRDYRSGTERCWTRPSQRGFCMTIK